MNNECSTEVKPLNDRPNDKDVVYKYSLEIAGTMAAYRTVYKF